MIWQLAAMHRLNLLEPSELKRLHEETRESVEAFAKEFVR
jgi:hypothetical protein